MRSPKGAIHRVNAQTPHHPLITFVVFRLFRMEVQNRDGLKASPIGVYVMFEYRYFLGREQRKQSNQHVMALIKNVIVHRLAVLS